MIWIDTERGEANMMWQRAVTSDWPQKEHMKGMAKTWIQFWIGGSVQLHGDPEAYLTTVLNGRRWVSAVLFLISSLWLELLSGRFQAAFPWHAAAVCNCQRQFFTRHNEWLFLRMTLCDGTHFYGFPLVRCHKGFTALAEDELFSAYRRDVWKRLET